jgi:CheY-like chemotaxis protein
MMSQSVELLLVEDNEDDAVIIQEVFADMRLATLIQVARDGEEALAYLQHKGKYKDVRMPDIVLLDINMPKKNGFEVLEEMKKDARLRSLPVIILSTSQREEDVVRSYATGACSYIHKLVDWEQFKHLMMQFEHYWTGISRILSARE